jgi:rod shape-determining protein MreD
VRRALIGWLLALSLLLVAAAAAGWFPRGWLPDPGLLVVIALARRFGGVRGLLAAWAIGWTCDLLTGSALGQYALFDLVAWGLTRSVQGRIELDRLPVLATFVAALTALEAGTLALTGPIHVFDPAGLAILAPHALANALAAPLVRRLVDGVLDRFDPSEAMRASLRFDAGAPGR